MVRRGLLLVGCCLLCLGVGTVGGYFVGRGDGWYEGLSKPWFTPPAWVFSPVWILLYVLMGVSLFLVIEAGQRGRLWWAALVVFGGQLVANGAWTPIFFGLQAPGVAFVEILVLWWLIGVTVVLFWKVRRWAGVILVPYWVWVSFAAVLNGTIWALN